MPSKRKGKLFQRGKSKGSRIESKRSTSSAVTGGYTRNASLKTYGGTEDSETVLLHWDYVAALSVFNYNTTVSYAIKGSAIYQPGGIATIGLGQTTNAVGYARLYTQYRRAMVISSVCEVTISSLNGTIALGHFTSPPVAMPVFAALTFCDKITAATYVATGTAMDLAGVPHAVSRYDLAGKGPTKLRCAGNTNVAEFGTARVTEDQAPTYNLSALTGADPISGFYYVLTLTNVGNLSIDLCQINIKVRYRVKFFDPVAAAVQIQDEPALNVAGTVVAVTRKSAPAEYKTTTTVEHKGDSKGTDLSAAEAFDEWGEVDSEYAKFLEARAAQKRAARRIVTTDQSLVAQIKGEPPLTTGLSVDPVTCPGRQFGAGAKTSAKGTT